MNNVKSVAILLVSLAVSGLIAKFCLLPPQRMADFVLGDDRCDLCGEPAVYKLLAQDRYLRGEYCRVHRWLGVINSDRMRTVMHVLLGASVFGIIYAVLSLFAGRRGQGLDDDIAGDVPA